MGNPIKGEVDFEAGGKKYRFVLGTYGLVALERNTGKSTKEFFAKPVDEWDVSDGLAVFHAGLMRHHEMTEREASDIMDELGDEAGRVVGEALVLTFGEQKEGDARPTKKAANGTGRRS